MRGVPLKVIQELMGHASLDMTMRYAHLSPETKQNAVQVLDQPAPVVKVSGERLSSLSQPNSHELRLLGGNETQKTPQVVEK